MVNHFSPRLCYAAAALFAISLSGCAGSSTQSVPNTPPRNRMVLLAAPVPGSLYLLGQGLLNRYDPPYGTSSLVGTYDVPGGDGSTFGRVAEFTGTHQYIIVAEKPSSTAPAQVATYTSGTSDTSTNLAQYTITGSATGLVQPSGIAVDQSGNSWVSDASTNTISTFHLGANGNVAPANTISGSNTQIAQPYKLAFDATGALYVANHASPGGILMFPQTASGNVAPNGVILGSSWSGATTYGDTWISFAIRNDGSIVAIPTSNDDEVLTFAPNPTDASSPSAVLTPKCSCHFVDVAIDDNSNVFLLSQSKTGYGVWEFPWGASGTGGVRSAVLPVANGAGLLVYQTNPTY